MIELVLLIDILGRMFENLSMGYDIVIVLATTLFCVILAAADSRVAVMTAFMLYTGEFIMFYEANLQGYSVNTYYPAAAMMLSFIILTLLLLQTYKSQNQVIV